MRAAVFQPCTDARGEFSSRGILLFAAAIAAQCEVECYVICLTRTLDITVRRNKLIKAILSFRQACVSPGYISES